MVSLIRKSPRRSTIEPWGATATVVVGGVVVVGAVLVDAAVVAGARVVVGVAVVVAAVVFEADAVVVAVGGVVSKLLLHAEATSSAATVTSYFFTV